MRLPILWVKFTSALYAYSGFSWVLGTVIYPTLLSNTLVISSMFGDLNAVEASKPNLPFFK